MVYGPLLDSLFGRLDPTPPERVRVLGDGEEIDIGGGARSRAIDSPGHAKHHLGFLDSGSGLLFAGDAVGVRLPDGGVLRPATPPPDFDLEAAVASLSSFAAARPSGIALAHYGLVPVEPQLLLEEAESILRAWAEEAERAWRAGLDIAEELERRFGSEARGLSSEQHQANERLSGFHSNAAGLRRYLERQAEAHA